jgi:cytochrome c553
MEDHLQDALDRSDAPALAKGLTRAAGFAPDPAWNAGAQGWSAIASSGAEAAKRADVDSARQACKTCHKAWRTKYKQAFRTRPVLD